MTTPRLYKGIRSSWIAIAEMMPAIHIRLWGVSIGRYWIGVIRREGTANEIVDAALKSTESAQ